MTHTVTAENKSPTPPAFGGAFSSRLIRKGLIIIAIPVLFSLMFIATLKFLLDEAQAQADREAHSREIMLAAGALGGSVVSAIAESYMSRLMHATTESPKAAQDARDTELRFHELQKAVIPGTHEAELVDRIGQNLNAAMKQSESGKMAQQALGDSLTNNQIASQRRRMGGYMTALMNDARALVDEAEKSGSAFPISEEQFKRMIDLFLYAGIAIELALAFGLMIFFSSNITSRLNVLMDNANRLADDRELNKPVTGKDEIATLDTVFHDMAEKLDQSRQLEREFLSRLQSIIETIPLGIVIVNDSAEVMSVSPSAEHLFDCTAGQVEGQPLGSMFKLASTKTSSELLTELSQKGSKHAHAFDAKRLDGSTFPSEVLSTEYNTSDVNGQLLVISDVTERHEVEKLKQSFVSMVSHELRSPLTSLQFCFKMLSKGHFGKLTEDGMRKVDLSEKNVKRLIGLVNEILDAERLESGQLSIDRAPEDLQEILDFAAGSVSAIADKAEVAIKVEETNIELDVDRNRLVQVVVNLLSNAIKFSPAGSTITISTHHSAGKVNVDITDQGRGIPPEHLDLVFKRFHQVKRTDASQKGGTGLGLAISKAIVEGHGGEIGVRSTVDVGSTFWFTLPAPTES